MDPTSGTPAQENKGSESAGGGPPAGVGHHPWVEQPDPYLRGDPRPTERLDALPATSHGSRCWNCHEPLVEGACPTKGCRGPGSGFEKPIVHHFRCIDCGTPTTQRYATALLPWLPGTSRSQFELEYVARCDVCATNRSQS